MSRICSSLEPVTSSNVYDNRNLVSAFENYDLVSYTQMCVAQEQFRGGLTWGMERSHVSLIETPQCRLVHTLEEVVVRPWWLLYIWKLPWFHKRQQAEPDPCSFYSSNNPEGWRLAHTCRISLRFPVWLKNAVVILGFCALQVLWLQSLCCWERSSGSSLKVLF